jgi:bifunctional UDP-N-acetylglucosamine pyrophosphorylase/glucosamine-1-phosphate N-acetyltransferase
MTVPSAGALVLAAGKGTRMKSETPKVLHPLLEEPILHYPLCALREAGFEKIAVVVGYGGETVAEWIGREWPDVEIVWQREQKGTGHAVQAAASWWRRFQDVLVVPGDTPLLSSATLASFADRHRGADAQGSFLSFIPPDPRGYGRVVRDMNGVRIVEEKDASGEERHIREVNSGIYLFRTSELDQVIGRLSDENAQREYYLTDVIPMLSSLGERVEVTTCHNPGELLGINTPGQLAEANALLRDRILDAWMNAGVKIADPTSTWIGPRAVLEEDVWIAPNVQIYGRCRIGRGCRIGSFSVLRDACLAENVRVEGWARISDSRIGPTASVGPFSVVRDGCELEEGVLAGRFVELKKTRLGRGAKVPHLSYLGDADVGEGTNVGAGTITCNYDGRRKNPTRIGRNCFVGSDTMLVAPVTLGDGASTGAGSVITRDVPEGALGIGRAKQRNIPDWASRRCGGEEEGR